MSPEGISLGGGGVELGGAGVEFKEFLCIVRILTDEPRRESAGWSSGGVPRGWVEFRGAPGGVG